ncbi:uncharacterized protein LOC116015212 isoform X2 [Ipomoea triloba]|uniref:uncharacterized protein LOC116015212 isoform X2 n=1 Tax=Ipomoea triloba TaxID=35885 RepID=UPI00125E98DD|nr:uncharacterized protein LOC116015212 isoform X2 [Ipomoea triloba]
MDVQPTALLNWALLCQGKSMDELRQWLLVTTMELEKTRMKAQEELEMRENQIFQLKDMLSRAMKEKIDAEEKCKRLLLEIERLLLQPPPPPAAAPMSGVSSIEDEPRIRGVDHSNNNGFSSSDSDESIVSSPAPAPATNCLPPQDSLLSITAYNSISNCGRINRKRGFFDDSDSSMEAKYQRVVL